MAFNTGLSGLRAASVDLDVTGNNIANASTVGFKGSKAQFGDLYASGFLSAGTAPVGDGVRVQDVKQSFSQGNISFTDSGLDMAISGDGFFILNNGGETRYSRAGQFGIDKDGFVTNNQGMRVQGFTADGDGNLSGIRGDLQIDSDNLAPRRTTVLETDVNLDSRESVLESRINSFPSLKLADIQNESVSVGYTDDRQNTPLSFDASESLDSVVAKINGVDGLTASASTSLPVAGMQNDIQAGSLNFELRVDSGSDLLANVDLSSVSSLEELRDIINNLQDNSISAFVTGPNELSIFQNQGRRLDYDFSYTDTAGDPQSGIDFETGDIDVTSSRVVETITDESGAVRDFAQAFLDGSVDRINQFNSQDQRSYNHATSTTIYDSLGNSHELTQFFVKEPVPGEGVGQSRWSVYLEIDGEAVAGTDRAPFTATFNANGGLESVVDPSGIVNATGEILVTDWTPRDANGDANGADGPPVDPTRIDVPISEPLDSSAFVIDLGGSTQFGAAFGVNDQQQNGYTTGRLSGLDVSDTGVIFARYTNGQSQSLGQVALASFNNTEGLSPVGDTSWVETFESGQPIVGAPDTGTLGSIAASSVEESNVDLSAELVNLIIAQRNYQANAKTIETSDAVTQTIINLR